MRKFYYPQVKGQVAAADAGTCAILDAGRYNAPNLELAHECSEGTLYLLQYNPKNGVWVVERPDSLTDP